MFACIRVMKSTAFAVIKKMRAANIIIHMRGPDREHHPYTDCAIIASIE